MKNRGGSLLGEELRLGNLKGPCSVQCLNIRDGCWMVTRGLEGSHSWRGTGLGGTVLLLCSRVPVLGGHQIQSMGSSKGSGHGRTGWSRDIPQVL